MISYQILITFRASFSHYTRSPSSYLLIYIVIIALLCILGTRIYCFFWPLKPDHVHFIVSCEGGRLS